MAKTSVQSQYKPKVKRIIIHGIKHACFACKIADDISPKANFVLELWSDKNGAASLGPAWFKGIIDLVHKDFQNSKLSAFSIVATPPGTPWRRCVKE